MIRKNRVEIAGDYAFMRKDVDRFIEDAINLNFPDRDETHFDPCPGCGLMMRSDGGKRYYCDECWRKEIGPPA